MADNIEQRYGLDASEALAALDLLNSAFAAHGKALDSLASKMTSFNSASATLGQSGKGVGSAFQSGMGQAQQSTDSLSKSLQTLAHITFTQVAIKGLRTLENAFSSAVDSAIHYQTSIA